MSPSSRTNAGRPSTKGTSVSSSSTSLLSSAAEKDKSWSYLDRTMMQPFHSKTVWSISQPSRSCSPKSMQKMITEKNINKQKKSVKYCIHLNKDKWIIRYSYARCIYPGPILLWAVFSSHRRQLSRPLRFRAFPVQVWRCLLRPERCWLAFRSRLDGSRFLWFLLVLDGGIAASSVLQDRLIRFQLTCPK